MSARDKFIEIYKSKIKREGADKLLEFICSPSSDFFTAPASARYHSAYEGGLCEHSINVYECLSAYLDRDEAREKYGLNYTDETIAIGAGFMSQYKHSLNRYQKLNFSHNSPFDISIEANPICSQNKLCNTHLSF